MRLIFLTVLAAAAALPHTIHAATSLGADSATVSLPANLTGPAEEAMNAYRNGDHAKAVALAKPLAEKNDPQALYLLGFASENGQGMPASRDKALEYYRQAAKLDNTDASYRISLILLASGDDKERAEAKSILEKAATTDPTVAGRILGEAWMRGSIDGKPNGKQAIEWWTRAADAGDVVSLILMARFFEGQFGFPDMRDGKKAMDAFAKAAGLGHAPAMAAYGSRLLSGDKQYRDEAKGREWLKKAIENKEISAYFVLGDYEENTKKDLKAALDYFNRGKDAGQIDCTLRAADFYLNGKGVAKDEVRGMELLEGAAKAGNAVANFQLAAAALKAEKPDLLKGYRYLLVAANANLPQAQNELGLLYLSGRLGVADMNAGTAWLTAAARAGQSLAQFNLGMLYLTGQGGVSQDLGSAADLFSRAANQGHAGAMLALANMLDQGAGVKADTGRAWALATLANEAGIKDADKVVTSTAKKLNDDTRAKARKLLSDIRSGDANPGLAPAKKSDQ